MQWLAEICVRRPVFASVLSLLIVVLGIAGYFQLGVDRFPKIDFPVVTVTTILPGASPVDVESDITDVIEGAVNTVGNIDELRSISSEGVSLVVAQFKLSVDPDIAAQDVRDRIDRVMRDLPEGTEPPVVSKIDPDASPIIYAALRSPGRPLREVTDMADNTVRHALESLGGVGQVRVLGGVERAVNVWLDPVKLQAYGISAGEVARAIGAENVSIPGGRVDTGRDQLTLRVNGRVADALDVGKLPVRTTGERAILVGDVARVEDSAQDAESAALWNGQPTVALAIRKQTGANTVAVADLVRERIGELGTELPKGYSIEVIRDESASIRTGTDGVKEHLVVGSLLAALVVLLFLGNFRSTLIAALAIPTSVLGTFAVMAALGYTLNTITLLALALSVGIVIDDAIVVLENIFRFVEEKGMSPREAAIEGTREIGMAVLATTFSLVAVFMPVVFMAGIPGRFLSGFGVTMTVAILVSLFVSFTLTPSLASRMLQEKALHQEPTRLQRFVDAFYKPIESAYLRALSFCLRHRWVVVVAAVGALALLPVLGGVAKKGFLPVDDQAQFEVTVRAPEGMSLAATTVHGERVARALRSVPGVMGTLVTIGANDQAAENVAVVFVRLSDPRDRAETQDDIKDIVRKTVLPSLDPGLRTSVNDVAAFGGGGQSTAHIQYSILGNDLDKLQSVAEGAVKGLKAFPGAVDVDSSLVLGKPEIGVTVDRAHAGELGVRVGDIAQALRLQVGGQKVSTYAENGKQYDVRVRAESGARGDIDSLGLLPMPTAAGGTVPLADLVAFKEGSGPSTINRLNRQRVVTLMANAAPGFGDNQVTDALVKSLADLHLPSDMVAKPAGQAKLMAEMGRSVLLGFGLAFIFMYLILAAQFESWVHPFTILLSLPLTLPFAVLSVVLTGQSLDMFSVLGIFVLFGIVKKNAILQIDHSNHLRAEGMPRYEAIMQANKDRLRPILMTTVAFVAGMIPLILSKGIGSGFNRATSGVVVGGQSLSLLLTLLATPVAYTIIEDILGWIGRQLSRLFRRKPAVVVEA